MRLETVIYWETEEEKRTRHGKRGILVNNGFGPLLDLAGNPVKEVWDYRRDGEFAVRILPFDE